MNPDSKVTSESQRFIARTHASRKKRYAKAIALILVAVAAGVVIGVSGSIMYFKSYYHRVPPRRDAIAQSIIGHMQSVLKLDHEEQVNLKSIIDSHMSELEEIRKVSSNNTRQLFYRMNDEIEKVLGEDRYKVWDDYKVKLWGDKHRHRNRYRRGPGR